MYTDLLVLGRRPANKYKPSYSITISYFTAETSQASCVWIVSSRVYAIQW